MQNVNTATTMANVFAAFKATKNPSTDLILLVQLSTLANVFSAKIRLRCFCATDKMWKLSKYIKGRERYPEKVIVMKYMLCGKNSEIQFQGS